MRWISLKPFAFLSILTCILLFPISPVKGDDNVILTVILNHQNKGEFYTIKTDGGDFFIKKEDLRNMGLKELTVTAHEIEGEEYILLSSVKGIGFQFDEASLTLEITALPSYFLSQTVDLTRTRPELAQSPPNASGFLNYSLRYTNESSAPRLISMSNELGFRQGDMLFFTDSDFTSTDDENRFVRLMTNMTYDRRQQLQRLIIGDFIFGSDRFGSNLNMGGISFQKAYFTAPYLITHPLEDISGSVTSPSKLDIYLDGTLFHSENLLPGEYNLRNIFPREGGGLMEIVLTDAFGRVTRIQDPFYLTTSLLKTGYHDYSYNAGFLREEFSQRSFKYGDAAFSAFHFYGVNDFLTIGLAAEASKRTYNLRPSSTLRLWNAGVMNLTLATSQDDDREKGLAASLDYSYQTPTFTTQWASRGFSKNYATIMVEPRQDSTKFETFVGVSYITKKLGSFGLSYGFLNRHDGSDQRTITARYSQSIFRNVRMIAQVSRIEDSDNINEFSINLIYSPTHDTSVSASYDRKETSNRESIQMQKDTPIGEGFGGRMFYQKTDSDLGPTDTFDAFSQYNARYGIFNGRYRSVDSDQAYELSAAGGLAYVAGTTSFGRPVTDSFALVEVGNLDNVRVYVNNNEIGRTDSSGKIFLPNLASYYDNQISIDDHDIPLDYSFPDTKLFVSPPERSGSHIKFEATKFRAIFGKIFVKSAGVTELLKSRQISMNIEGKEVVFDTTSDGEFYLENVNQGQYQASFIYYKKRCTFDIIVPKTDEGLIDLGDLVCETAD